MNFACACFGGRRGGGGGGVYTPNGPSLLILPGTDMQDFQFERLLSWPQDI